MIRNNDDLFYGDLFSEQELEDTPSRKIYSIKDINKIVKDRLENEFSEIWIQGEISNSTLHSSGHYYFSLKDEAAQIRAVMFKHLYGYLKFTPENGTKVLVKGNLTCFIKGGSYQINVVYMEPQGIGSLQLAFEQLKKRLQSEGLFDSEHKQQIPMLPQKIGVITSPTGAAIRDILSVINRRYANLNIILYPVRVQGDNAKFEIVKAIEYFNKNKSLNDIDVLLVGRGGGSIEDLWAFNEEMVARAIFNSKIPIISCVGHEIDFVISDFVADLRAPTPSAAAELVVRDKQELLERLNYYNNKIKQRILYVLNNYSQALEYIKDNRFLKDPILYFQDKFQQLDYFNEKIEFLIKKNLDSWAYKLGFLKAKLENLSPDKIIKRGYAVIKDENNKVINLEKVKKADKIKVMGNKTELLCEVLDVNNR